MDYGNDDAKEWWHVANPFFHRFSFPAFTGAAQNSSERCSSCCFWCPSDPNWRLLKAPKNFQAGVFDSLNRQPTNGSWLSKAEQMTRFNILLQKMLTSGFLSKVCELCRCAEKNWSVLFAIEEIQTKLNSYTHLPVKELWFHLRKKIITLKVLFK